MPARGPAVGRDEGLRRGSRRAGCTPGRCAPARRCVIPAPAGAGMVPPPGILAAMLAAATRSRCPACPQCGHVNTRPAGFRTRRAHAGHVEDVPRSSTSRTMIPAASALSDKARIRCPIRHARVRWLCRTPAARSKTPRGSPTASVPIRLGAAQPTTVLGGLMLGLPHPPPMPGVHHPVAAAVPPPSPRRALPRPGSTPRCRAATALGVTQVLAALGADRPPGHQQPPPVRPGERHTGG